jgi:hypothetical protein
MPFFLNSFNLIQHALMILLSLFFFCIKLKSHKENRTCLCVNVYGKKNIISVEQIFQN